MICLPIGITGVIDSRRTMERLEKIGGGGREGEEVGKNLRGGGGVGCRVEVRWEGIQETMRHRFSMPFTSECKANCASMQWCRTNRRRSNHTSLCALLSDEHIYANISYFHNKFLSLLSVYFRWYSCHISFGELIAHSLRHIKTFHLLINYCIYLRKYILTFQVLQCHFLNFRTAANINFWYIPRSRWNYFSLYSALENCYPCGCFFLVNKLNGFLSKSLSKKFKVALSLKSWTTLFTHFMHHISLSYFFPALRSVVNWHLFMRLWLCIEMLFKYI